MRRALVVIVALSSCLDFSTAADACVQVGGSCTDGPAGGSATAGGSTAGGATAGGGSAGGSTAGGSTAGGSTAGGSTAGGGSAGGSTAGGGTAGGATAGGVPFDGGWAAVQSDILGAINSGKDGGTTVALFSSLLAGPWVGGVLVPGRRIIGIPYADTNMTILEIPLDAGIPVVVPYGGSPYTFVGGVLAPNGNVYGIPYTGGTQLLEISPADAGAASLVGTPIVDAGSLSAIFGAGVTALNGAVYVMPFYGPRVLRFEPTTRTSHLVGTEYQSGSDKWLGAVLGPNGKVYGIPYRSAHGVLVLDTATDTTTTLPISNAAASGWQGGTLAADGHIYCAPSSGGLVLEINPFTGGTSTFDAGTPATGMQLYLSGALGADGKIYALPSTASPKDILVIDPVTKTTSKLATGVSGSDPWDGLVSAPDGKLYGIPSSESRILVIDPKVNAPIPERALLTPFLNKY